MLVNQILGEKIEIRDLKGTKFSKSSDVAHYSQNSFLSNLKDKISKNPDKVSQHGQGTTATVFSKKTEEIVRKVAVVRGSKTNSDQPFLNDGYSKFILASQKYWRENPYLPRVYDIKFFRTKNGMVYLKATLEKLTSIKDEKIPYESLASIYRKAFNDEPPTQTGGLINKLVDFISNGIYGSNAHIKDPFLKKVIKMLHAFRGGSDMSENNIMIRFTSVGPQLVLTDPV